MSKKKFMRTFDAMEKRGAAIQDARKAAAELLAASETLREKIDSLEAALNAIANEGGPLDDWQRIQRRLLDIRQRRNGMECFELQCRIGESLDAAWKAMP